MDLISHLQYRDVAASPALTRLVETELLRLKRHHPNLQICQVTIGRSHRHHQHGRQFEVTLHLMNDLGELLVNRRPSTRALRQSLSGRPATKAVERGTSHADPYLTVREAFGAARRQLDEQARRERSQLHHVDPLAAVRADVRRTDGEAGLLSP